MATHWVSWDLLAKLRDLLEDRQIDAGIALLDRHRGEWSLAGPDKCHIGSALGCLARWVDVGYEDEALLKELLERFPANQRQPLPVGDYVELRMAEALVAMREENLTKASQHMGSDPTVQDHLGDLYQKTGRLKLAAAHWERAINEWNKTVSAEVDQDEVAKVTKKLESAKVKLAKEDSSNK